MKVFLDFFIAVFGLMLVLVLVFALIFVLVFVFVLINDDYFFFELVYSNLLRSFYFNVWLK